MWPFRSHKNKSEIVGEEIDRAHEDLTSRRMGKVEDETWIESSDEGELAVDVFQKGSDIIIQASVGGVRPEDIDIDVDRDIVTIRGNRKSPFSISEDQYYIRECHWGSFSRTIVLPVIVDATRAEADFKDGIVTITAPRNERGTNIPLRVHRRKS